GGYMTLAATLCSKDISDTISNNPPNVFMHGPTFMGNPLACAVALASIHLLQNSDWQANVQMIEQFLTKGLEQCKQLNDVVDVRVLGAIGVVELKNEVNMPKIQQAFVDAGVWIRPFGKLIYLMPPYIIKEHEIKTLTNAIFDVINNEKHR
ncbi:MAG: aminotransferase class III-fold pyridoxal phosphate-dependent enzyme, partial [Gammaproteobacteria bacterium]|nr:aminotransferase class III-fold pyridoxal phosphate-dependent enzyme [Gammaproteobacteria bacterium]